MFHLKQILHSQPLSFLAPCSGHLFGQFDGTESLGHLGRAGSKVVAQCHESALAHWSLAWRSKGWCLEQWWSRPDIERWSSELFFPGNSSQIGMSSYSACEGNLHFQVFEFCFNSPATQRFFVVHSKSEVEFVDRHETKTSYCKYINAICVN